MAATDEQFDLTDRSRRTNRLATARTDPSRPATQTGNDHLTDRPVDLPELLLQLPAANLTQQPVQLPHAVDVEPAADWHQRPDQTPSVTPPVIWNWADTVTLPFTDAPTFFDVMMHFPDILTFVLAFPSGE